MHYLSWITLSYNSVNFSSCHCSLTSCVLWPNSNSHSRIKGSWFFTVLIDAWCVCVCVCARLITGNLCLQNDAEIRTLYSLDSAQLLSVLFAVWHVSSYEQQCSTCMCVCNPFELQKALRFRLKPPSHWSSSCTSFILRKPEDSLSSREPRADSGSDSPDSPLAV